MFRFFAFVSIAALFNVSAFSEDETNVTAKVTAAVRDNKLSIMSGNGTFGDTAPNVVKRLRVDYSIDGKNLTKEAAENERLEIAAPAGQKLVIKKAVYGPADGSTPKATITAVSTDPAQVLDTLPGFKIEHLLRADRAKNGSWICMAKDPKGRLLLGAQNGQPITRVTIKDGKVDKQEILQIPISETMGMLFVDNVLYLNGHGRNDKGKSVFGLFRCKDSKGDEGYNSVEFLREWPGGSGEHGAHGIVLGPDKMLYIVCGNFTRVPDDLAPSTPHRNYADDLVLPRAEDGNGFGAGMKPPGGYVVRMDLDGKKAELYASGERNTYDIAFNADGELFGFDSDMEWDWGNPWYRPVRVFHAMRGADHGFREGSAKWPEYYHDSLPAVVNIGIGCPTGVGFGTGAKFPLKYQKAFYILDWSYGRLIAVHLTPTGGSYTGTWENFVAPKGLNGGGAKTPLNLTDMVIGDDGAMYFTIGGRGTQASLFRVTYSGNEPAAPADQAGLHDKEGAEARELRHKLEAFNVKPDAAAVEFAWPHLNSADRATRYAARLAVECNPADQWEAKALNEKQPKAALTALLALARYGAKDKQAKLLTALTQFKYADLADEQKLEKLRVIEVSIARHGAPDEALAKQLADEMAYLRAANNEFLDRESSQILLALNAPNAVANAVALLKAARTQEEQVAYALQLRTIKNGWTTDLRRQYLSWWNGGKSNEHPAHVLKWFADAGIKFNNGASFPNFMAHLHEDAKFTMTHDEITALNDVLAAYNPAPLKKPKVNSARKLVKEWTTADLQPLLDQVGQGRNFKRGKDVYEEAQCLACHRYGDQGGAVGPDLTAVSARFKRQDILEALSEPSKVLSEQYMNTAIKTADGKVVIGRIANEDAQTITIRPNPLEQEMVTVKKADIKARDLSKKSPMPEGLLNNFSKEEILDLMAFLESQGDSKRSNFK